MIMEIGRRRIFFTEGNIFIEYPPLSMTTGDSQNYSPLIIMGK